MLRQIEELAKTLTPEEPTDPPSTDNSAVDNLIEELKRTTAALTSANERITALEKEISTIKESVENGSKSNLSDSEQPLPTVDGTE